jgi:hypothetical protein
MKSEVLFDLAVLVMLVLAIVALVIVFGSR